MSDDLMKRLRADMTRDEFFLVAESVLTLAVDRIEELEAKLAKAVEALDEAIYMLVPDEKDMENRAGIYRIVTAYEELKGETNN